MPSRQRQPTANELLQLAVAELDQSIHQPNILNYGEKDYPEQLRFHKSKFRGRFISGGNRGEKPTLRSLSLSGGLQILIHILSDLLRGVLGLSS
jgi:hypothetical protein